MFFRRRGSHRVAPLAASVFSYVLSASSAHALTPIEVAGPPFVLEQPRPNGLTSHTPTFGSPVSVHSDASVSLETLLATQRAAEQTLHMLQARHHFPAPLPDGLRGGGPELDIYLVPPAQLNVPGEAVPEGLEYGASYWDQSPSFVRVDNTLTGHDLERAVAEGVAQAILLSIDARQIRPLRLAMAHTLATYATGLRPDPVATSAFQRDPSHALFSHRDDLSARGAGVFLRYLNEQYQDANDPLKLLRGLAWMPITRTWPSAATMNGNPDFFSCLWLLSYIQHTRTGGIEKIITDFALSRAIADTEAFRKDLRGVDMGAEPDVELLSRVSFNALPVLVSPHTLPRTTGMAFVEVDTRDVGDASLNIWFHGSSAHEWRITALRLDAQGHSVGRVSDSPVVEGQWGTTITFYKDCARIVIAIVNVGDGHLDLDDPHDEGAFFTLHMDKGT